MTTDTWVTMLEAIEPEYQRLKKMIDGGPSISCTVSKRNTRHWIRIHEDWGNTPSNQQYTYYTANDNKVTERIDWAVEQLSSWKFVTRTSYDQWAFLRKKDAEKFKTLFTLKWAQ